jgi:hypothetical protein
MNTRNRLLALAVAAALAMPAAAAARELNFNYLEVNYLNVDVDFSESFVDNGDSVSLKTDSDGGFQIGGSWQVWENLHLFGEYAEASQDIKATLVIAGDTFVEEDDFDVIRWRLGVGYAYPVSSILSVYGRLSFDRIEFDFDGFTDKDDGLGAEVGALWAAMPQFHLQGYVRYTSVGDWVFEEENKFDSDTLVGVSGRWFVTDAFAVQAGYEVGEINTWSIGLRMGF